MALLDRENHEIEASGIKIGPFPNDHRMMIVFASATVPCTKIAGFHSEVLMTLHLMQGDLVLAMDQGLFPSPRPKKYNALISLENWRWMAWG